MSSASNLPCECLRWSGRTDTGKVRKNNEDCFIAQTFDAHEVHHLGRTGEGDLARADFVFAVSDGMGGALAGEFASRITVEKITRLLPRSFRLEAMGLSAGADEVLSELYTQIHGALTFVGASYEECTGMQATLSMCWFTQGRMHFAHIGDSRIYHFPAGEKGLQQLSHDDTYVGWLHRTGQINEREAREHPRRNLLQKALGAGNQFVDPQVGSVAFAAGDRFLLCTDGLFEGLYDEQIADLVRLSGDVATAATQLVNASLDRSGRDNTTALVVEVG